MKWMTVCSNNSKLLCDANFETSELLSRYLNVCGLNCLFVCWFLFFSRFVFKHFSPQHRLLEINFIERFCVSMWWRSNPINLPKMEWREKEEKKNSSKETKLNQVKLVKKDICVVLKMFSPFENVNFLRPFRALSDLDMSVGTGFSYSICWSWCYRCCWSKKSFV